VQFFTKAVEINPQSVQAYRLLAMLYVQDEKFAQAIEAISKVIEIEPDDIDAYLFHSRCLIAQKKFSQAAADLEAVLERMPEEDLYKELVTIYRMQGDFDKEEATYPKAVSLFPKDCQIRQTLAESL